MQHDDTTVWTAPPAGDQLCANTTNPEQALGLPGGEHAVLLADQVGLDGERMATP